MYFSTYLLCIDRNFYIQIPRFQNTNKGDGNIISFGSILHFEPFCTNRVYFLGESDNFFNQSNDLMYICQFYAINDSERNSGIPSDLYLSQRLQW